MLGLIVVCCVVLCAHGAAPSTHTTDKPNVHQTTHGPTVTELEKRLKDLEQTVGSMARQMMLQQLFVEERIRTGSQSGVKQIRQGTDATTPYLLNSYAGGSALGIHEHCNYDRTVGMGELNVVLNGVDFRTRHNDYKLMMPDKSTAYNKVVPIPFPPVPNSVKNKHTIAEQIAEMREYFRAFKYQNTHIRDYRPYFKPVMCYLEGGWTTDTKSLSEPFHSDRHHIDASSWMDLQEKVRFTSYTGGKSELENFSYLPTTIINVTDDGQPHYAQWNYRILCHPIREAFHRYDFKMVDDLAVRMHLRRNMTAYAATRAPRYVINYRSRKAAFDPNLGSSKWSFGTTRYGLLDKIMAEIPGKDNYHGYLEDDSFGSAKMSLAYRNNTKLNTAFYHRWFKNERRGAMGLTVRHRGFSDSNLWVAQTSNPRIAPMSVTDCKKDPHTHKNVCHKYTRRYTYAIPLEIIWLTPLYTWNPYNLAFHTTGTARRGITLNGRNGGLDKAHAFNGTSFNYYYFTPSDFFHGGNVAKNAADTAKDSVGILDKHGEVKKVMASGTRVFLPDIPGVGKLRMRYPVFPVDVEGSAIWKETMALQDVVMDMKRYTNMFETRPEVTDLDAHPPDTKYKTSTTHKDPPGMHYHEVSLTSEQMTDLNKNGTVVHVFTTHENGHEHEMEVSLDPHNHNQLIVKSCDNQPDCWDGHNRWLYLEPN